MNALIGITTGAMFGLIFTAPALASVGFILCCFYLWSK